MQDINPAIVEAVARAGFAAGAAIAAREFGLGKPVTWDEHLTDTDRERELARTRALLSAAYPLIAAKALRDAASEYAPGLVDRGYMKRYLTSRADHIERGES